MNKKQSALLVTGLMFFLGMTSASSAQTGADTMGTGPIDTMEASMKSASDDKMKDGMEAGTMDKGVDENMRDTMK